MKSESLAAPKFMGLDINSFIARLEFNTTQQALPSTKYSHVEGLDLRAGKVQEQKTTPPRQRRTNIASKQ